MTSLIFIVDRCKLIHWPQIWGFCWQKVSFREEWRFRRGTDHSLCLCSTLKIRFLKISLKPALYTQYTVITATYWDPWSPLPFHWRSAAVRAMPSLLVSAFPSPVGSLAGRISAGTLGGWCSAEFHPGSEPVMSRNTAWFLLDQDSLGGSGIPGI